MMLVDLTAADAGNDMHDLYNQNGDPAQHRSDLGDPGSTRTMDPSAATSERSTFVSTKDDRSTPPTTS